MTNINDNEPEWGGAGRRTLRGRLVRYLPLLGFLLAGGGVVLGTAYLRGGKDLVDSDLACMRRWNVVWMWLSVFASYILACEISDTQWFRRFGIEMMQERLQGLLLAFVLGSFCLVVPFRTAWTNYWLVRDGRQVRAVVTDNGETVGYRYRVNGNEYAACCYKKIGVSGMAVGELVTVYYSASHPSVSEVKLPVSMVDGAWPVIIIFFWPVEFAAIVTVVSPRSKWAYRFGTRNILPPAMSGAG